MASGDNFEDVMQGAMAVNPQATPDEVVKVMKDKNMLESILKTGNKVKILITGKTGVGKSTLVNGLIGRGVAEVNLGLSSAGVTQEVTPYDRKADDLDVVVYDSPGLQDGSGNDKKYLEMLYSKCKDVNLVIFAIRMESRFVPGNPDEQAMIKFTQKFGILVWKKAMVVITCANIADSLHPTIKYKSASAQKEFFKKTINDYKKLIQEVLQFKAKVPAAIAEKVKVIPAGYETEPYLLDGSLWFSQFWWACLKTSTKEARAFLLKVNKSRLRQKKTANKTDLSKPLHEQPIILPDLPERLKESFKEVKGVAIVVAPAVVGGMIGALTLLAGPVGVVGIPVGAYLGIIIGSALLAHT